MRAPLVWLFAILVVPQRHIRCVECMHGLPEDVVVPFFEGNISKFDKHMLLNWVTQPLTRHLFPVDFFQQVVDGKMRLVSVDDESVFEATSFTTVQADKDG